MQQMKTWLSVTNHLYGKTLSLPINFLQNQTIQLLTGGLGLFNTPAEKYGFDSYNILK